VASGIGAGYLRRVNDEAWKAEFRAVWDAALDAYAAGARSPKNFLEAPDREYLGTLGCSPQELFDFVEDHATDGEPGFDEVLGVTALRRDWFLTVQGGQASGRRRSVNEFPAKSAALAGVPWLPRILAKAEAKLRGELPPELMYGCGGDRAFLRGIGVGLTEFLAAVREAKGDEKPVVALVKRRSPL
jgi:hypothetical protein